MARVCLGCGETIWYHTFYGLASEGCEMTPEDQTALEIAKVVFDHFGILWPKNYEDHTGELIERLKPILITFAAAQKERDAAICDARFADYGERALTIDAYNAALACAAAIRAQP